MLPGKLLANMRQLFFACAVLLVACTTTRGPQGATPSMSDNEEAIAAYFSLTGRISVRVSDKIDSGQIQWVRGVENERIRLFSPLGSQVAELVSDKKTGVVMLRQGTQTVTSVSVSELTQSLLGVRLELDRVAEWVQGIGLIENQATDVMLVNGEAWRVTAERYQTSGNFRFASRLSATRGDTAVRLVIDEWASP